MIKFPTEYDVGEVRGHQVAARECYIAMLEIDDHLWTISMEEQQMVAKLRSYVESLKVGRIVDRRIGL